MDRQQSRPSSGGMLGRLFSDHPRSLGMSWLGHSVGAVRIAGTMIAAGTACLVHAVVPGWFTQTAGRTVERLHDQMHKRRAGAAYPAEWPDYEI